LNQTRKNLLIEKNVPSPTDIIPEGAKHEDVAENHKKIKQEGGLPYEEGVLAERTADQRLEESARK